jgi:eukaryotic-like serine/threonine-protein kinase
VATKGDLELARRLLAAGVLDEARVRAALDTQGRLLREGRQVALERVFYARHDLPPESLAPLHAPPLVESQPFTNYRLIAPLGEGGASRVYAAVYVPNGVPVAVKVLDPIQALRDDWRARFYEEARLHVELEHENIVAGYEFGFEAGLHFYTMDRVEGATVLEVIDRRGSLTSDEALSVTMQIARALGFLHEHGYIHRDIKPGNVMVEASGRARLIDLGLVRRMDAGGVPGEETMTVGTVEYLSPEQARGRSDLDARADLYSLGMTLYHMVVGEVPFQGETDYEVMAKQILSSMDAQKIKQRHIPPEIYFLISKLAAKDRDERWSSAAEALRVIEGYLPQGVVPIDLGAPAALEPVVPPPRPPAGAQPPRNPSRRAGPRRRRRR